MMPGAVRLRVADLARMREFYERAIGLRALDEGEGGLQAGRRRHGGGGARLEPRGPRAPAPNNGAVSPRDPGPWAGPARPGPYAGGGRRLAAVRRLGPSRQRGALPQRPRGQRHRDLPRPATLGVAP